MKDAFTLLAGPMIGVVSILTAWLAYRRGQRADNRAADLAANTQVYSEYRSLLAELRQQLIEARKEIAEVRSRLEEALRQLDELRRKALNG